MVVFFAELWDWVGTGRGHFYVITFALGALVWLLVVTVGRQYQPFTGSYEGTVSVIVPVVAEEPDLFDELLRRIAAQHPREIIVVINGPRNLELEAVCSRQEMPVETLWTAQPGKRNALKLGIEQATGDIVALVDSDTFWMPDTMVELTRPFAESTVGGVTTHQTIRDPRRTVWTRYADWLELIRFSYNLRAQSALGQIGTLPGRTIAFRRTLIAEYLPEFVSEKFMGIHKEISDDRCMTTYVLQAGYQTVYQSTSVVLTDAPTTFRMFFRQQYRWANGGQYNTIRTAKWMMKNSKPLAAMTLFPLVGVYLFAGALIAWGIVAVVGDEGRGSLPLLVRLPFTALLLAILGSWAITTLIRYFRVFRASPYHLLWLAPWTLFGLFLMAPLRVWAFARMTSDAGWGTRKGAYKGVGQRAPLRYRLLPPLSVFAAFGLSIVAATALEFI